MRQTDRANPIGIGLAAGLASMTALFAAFNLSALLAGGPDASTATVFDGAIRRDVAR